MTRIFWIFLAFISLQAFSQRTYQDQFYIDQLEMVKSLISQPHINESNFIEYIPHSGPIAVSMLRKALKTEMSHKYFDKVLINKLIASTEKKIFEWDGIEAKGRIHIIGEIHDHEQSIHIRNTMIDLYKNEQIILGLEGYINNDMSTLEDFHIHEFSRNVFGLESEFNYSVAMLFKYHFELIEKMKTTGVGSELADYISKFSASNQYVSRLFNEIASQSHDSKKALGNINKILGDLVSSQNLEKKEIDDIVDLYTTVGSELLNRFNKRYNQDLNLYKIRDVIVNYLDSEENGDEGWNQLVELIVDKPREADFIYNIQNFISLNALRKPVIIIVGEAHVETVSSLLTQLYPNIDITFTRNSSILEDDCSIMKVIESSK